VFVVEEVPLSRKTISKDALTKSVNSRRVRLWDRIDWTLKD
jgi:hypothetical protein